MRLRLGFYLAFLCVILGASSLRARPIHDPVCIDGCDQWRNLPQWRKAEIADRLSAIGADSFRLVAHTSALQTTTLATTVNQAGGAVAAPAPGSSWIAIYVIMRNTTTDTVTQTIGHLTFHHEGFNDVVIEPSVTFAANETKRIKDLSSNFDADWQQFCGPAHGLYILAIDARIEATELLQFAGSTTKFELNSSGPYGPRALTAAGQGNDYVRIVTDAETKVGAFPTVFNMNCSAVQLQVIQRGPLGGSDAVTVFTIAPPGVSQFGVPRSLPNGGSLSICHTGCGVGTPGTTGPVYIFAVVGPNDGGTQGIRYAQPPLSP